MKKDCSGIPTQTFSYTQSRDAILGAMGAGDIGRHFPDTDERFKGASSVKLMKHVINMAKENGYTVVNIDSNIIAQKPKMMPHIDSMVKNISTIVGSNAAVSVKARSNEKLDAVGQCEAIAAQAVVLLEKFPS